MNKSSTEPASQEATKGIGGLGHLGIQFANKVWLPSRSYRTRIENAAFAKKLGAHVYIDRKATNAAEALQELGGAQVILATARPARRQCQS